MTSCVCMCKAQLLTGLYLVVFIVSMLWSVYHTLCTAGAACKGMQCLAVKYAKCNAGSDDTNLCTYGCNGQLPLTVVQLWTL